MRQPSVKTVVPVLCTTYIQDNGDGTWTASVAVHEAIRTCTRHSHDEALKAVSIAASVEDPVPAPPVPPQRVDTST